MKSRPAHHPLLWILEPLEVLPGYFRRRMFGCEAAWVNDRLVLVLADGEEPWNGMMICAERDHHPELLRRWPVLKSHPILGKWLYLSQRHPDFESLTAEVTERIRAGDPAIGSLPNPRKKKKKKKKIR